MKKRGSLFIALLCMVLLLTGCTTIGGGPAGNGISTPPAPEIYGIWIWDTNLSDVVVYTCPDSLKPYIKTDGLTVPTEISFKEDGTYSFDINKEDARIFLEEFLSRVKTAIKEAIEDNIGTSLIDGGVVDEYLRDKTISEDDVSRFVKNNHREGQFLEENNKLYLSNSLEEEINQNCYYTYSLSSTTLILKEYVNNTEVTDCPFGEIYPLTCVRKS